MHAWARSNRATQCTHAHRRIVVAGIMSGSGLNESIKLCPVFENASHSGNSGVKLRIRPQGQVLTQTELVISTSVWRHRASQERCHGNQ